MFRVQNRVVFIDSISSLKYSNAFTIGVCVENQHLYSFPASCMTVSIKEMAEKAKRCYRVVEIDLLTVKIMF